MDPFLTVAASNHVEIATTTPCSAWRRLTVSVAVPIGPDEGSVAASAGGFVWAVEVDAPMNIKPLTRPEANPARTR